MAITEPTTAPIDPSARWYPVAAELREHRGQWRLIVRHAYSIEAAKSLAKEITSGRRVAFRPAGHYRGSSTGHEVKAIYLGPHHPAGGGDTP